MFTCCVTAVKQKTALLWISPKQRRVSTFLARNRWYAAASIQLLQSVYMILYIIKRVN